MCPPSVPQGGLWRLMNWYLWSALRSVDERPYEVKSAWMIIKLPCLRSDSRGLGELGRKACSLSSIPLLEQRRLQPVLVKMGLSLCGWMSSGLHILSPFFPAPWLGPDAGSSPALLIGMLYSSPACGESSGLQSFKRSEKLLCEGPRVPLDPLTKKGQPFPASWAPKLRRITSLAEVGGYIPHLQQFPMPRFLFFPPFPSSCWQLQCLFYKHLLHTFVFSTPVLAVV